MKKSLLLFLTLIVLVCNPTMGQTFKRKASKPIEATSTNQIPSFRNITGGSVGIPQVFTNEAAFLAAIGSDYALDDYTGFVVGGMSSVLNRVAGTSGYSYEMSVSSPDSLFNTYDGVSTYTDADSIFIVNTGKAVKAFGGYFYDTDINLMFASGPIRIVVSDYTYTFSPTDSLSFLGFIFPGAITGISVANANPTGGAWVTVDHLYFSDVSLSTSIENANKKMTIYPNPTAEGITVNAEGNILIYNTAGQLLIDQAVTEGSYVSLAALPKGQYLVKINAASGVLEEKLIKK